MVRVSRRVGRGPGRSPADRARAPESAARPILDRGAWRRPAPAEVTPEGGLHGRTAAPRVAGASAGGDRGGREGSVHGRRPALRGPHRQRSWLGPGQPLASCNASKRADGPRASGRLTDPPARRVSPEPRPFVLCRTPERFHVLFNSLCRVLFNFPERYLSSIGLAAMFSLRWSLPPLRAALPSDPTLRRDPPAAPCRPPRVFHPLRNPITGEAVPGRGFLGPLAAFGPCTGPGRRPESRRSENRERDDRTLPNTTFPGRRLPPTGFGAGLLPVRSPLLRES